MEAVGSILINTGRREDVRLSDGRHQKAEFLNANGFKESYKAHSVEAKWAPLAPFYNAAKPPPQPSGPKGPANFRALRPKAGQTS